MKQFLIIGRSRRDTILRAGFDSQKEAEREAHAAVASDTLSEAHVFESLASFTTSSINRSPAPVEEEEAVQKLKPGEDKSYPKFTPIAKALAKDKPASKATPKPTPRKS